MGSQAGAGGARGNELGEGCWLHLGKRGEEGRGGERGERGEGRGRLKLKLRAPAFHLGGGGSVAFRDKRTGLFWGALRRGKGDQCITLSS